MSYSDSTYPITPVEPLKAILYDYFGISVYFVYFIYIYKRQNIYVCMYVCPHISSEITEPNSTKLHAPSKLPWHPE